MPYPNTHKPNKTSWSSLAVDSGAIVSSARDMVDFLYALMNGQILKEETLLEMQRFLPAKDAGDIWNGYGRHFEHFVAGQHTHDKVTDTSLIMSHLPRIY